MINKSLQYENYTDPQINLTSLFYNPLKRKKTLNKSPIRSYMRNSIYRINLRIESPTKDCSIQITQFHSNKTSPEQSARSPRSPANKVYSNRGSMVKMRKLNTYVKEQQLLYGFINQFTT
ncbi:hypothetical protein pb186bvf_011790 [Paramecium bursaria]